MNHGHKLARTRSTRFERLLFPMVLVFGAACVSPEMRDDNQAGRVSEYSGAPAWVGLPPGWSKLEQIERWLRSDEASYQDTWRVQAELALGEGRLTFARRDQPAGAPPNSWLARVQSAQAGFKRVLGDPQCSPSQEQRARRGLEAISELIAQVQQPQATPARNGAQLARAQWKARAPKTNQIDPARGFERITIHHTANVPGTRFDGSYADTINVIQKVQREHMDNEGWADIGYHFMVDSEGRVLEGRSLQYQGAHAGGANNKHNIGICLIGNFQHRQPSAKAMNSLDRLVTSLRQEHGIRRTELLGHMELKATECPGPALASWTRRYRASGPRLSQLKAESPSPSLSQATPHRQASTRSSGWSRSGNSSTVR